MRHRVVGNAVLALALAGCQVSAGGKPVAPGVAPTKAPASGSPSPGAKAAVPAGPPAILKPPAGATAVVAGRVYLEAAYATGPGGGSRLTGQDGGALIGMGGASPAGADGTLVADGRVVAARGGNVIVPANLAGGGLIGQDGGSLIGQDGGSLIGNAGNTLVGNAGNTYRVAQAGAAPAFGEAWPAAGMWISLVDARTGYAVALGKDAAGKDVFAVYTDATGAFTLHVPPELAPHLRVVARAPGLLDPRLVLNVLGAGEGPDRRIDDLAAATSNFLRAALANRLLDLLDAQRGVSADALAGAQEDASSQSGAALIALVSTSSLGRMRTTFEAIGANRLDEARKRELALVIADRILVEINYETRPITFGSQKLFDPGVLVHAERNVPAKRLVEQVMREIRDAVVADLPPGADPAAHFGAKPYVVAANLKRRPDARYRIDKAADMLEFIVNEYLAANDHEQYYKIQDVLADLGRPPATLDLLAGGGETFLLGFFERLLQNAAADGSSPTEFLLALLQKAGAELVKAPAPPRTAGPAPRAAPPVPAPPAPEPAWTVDTLAGGPGLAAHADGAGPAARFSHPLAIALDDRDAQRPVLYVADAYNAVIRRVTLDPTGPAVVTTIAGQPARTGRVDGPGPTALFHFPRGLALDVKANPPVLYVAEAGSHAIRRLRLAADGSASVDTLAGGEKGFADGPGADARFDSPYGLALDAAGDLFVADTNNQRVRKIAIADPAHAVTTLLGNGDGRRLEGRMADARIDAPVAMAFAADGSLFVMQLSGVIRHVQAPFGPDTPVRLVAGGVHRVGEPDGYYHNAWSGWATGFALDPAGRPVMGEVKGNRLRVVADGRWLRSFAGSTPYALGKDPDTGGHADGPAETAKFYKPGAIAIGRDGTIYVAEEGNHMIRRVKRVAPGG